MHQVSGNKKKWKYKVLFAIKEKKQQKQKMEFQ